MSFKKEPEQAVEGILDWVMQERKDRDEREAREAERKAKRDANQPQDSLGSFARLGITPTTAVGQPLASWPAFASMLLKCDYVIAITFVVLGILLLTYYLGLSY